MQTWYALFLLQIRYVDGNNLYEVERLFTDRRQSSFLILIKFV